jgi:two-component system CheB/CheR fusion protein
VEANHIYVIPPNTNLGIAQGVLKLHPRPQNRGAHHPIDAFLESLAQDQHECAIGVILSGTATDGTLGLEAIKAEGGITFAQDDSAKYNSMPRSAMAAGCVDFVLKPENIAKELARIAKHPYVANASDRSLPRLHPEAEREADQSEGPDAPLASGGHGSPRTGARQARAEAKAGRDQAPSVEENGFKKVLLLLRNHCGVDFSLYKSTTIQRRITRRVVLNKHDTVEDYARFLRGNSQELDALYSDCLISVTSFFRNPETFELLQRKIFPRLLQQRQRDDQPLRVWVVGCSTGQEAYSIAMAFQEAQENLPRARKLQVFATDLNDVLLDKARYGLYTKHLAQDLSPERLRRFFVEENGGFRVIKPLREMVVFARQNLISDPPFSRMDLISCRNLLIYLEPSLQKKALPTFHYALKPEGFLFLGASESITGFTDLFEPLDRKHKIYAKKTAATSAFHLPMKKERGEARRVVAPSGARPADWGQLTPLPGQPEDLRGELNAQREADRVMVNQFAPPSVLINAELQILQFRGPTSAWLEPPTGKASFDVLKMAREGLMLPLRAAINKAKKENKIARRQNVRVQQNGQNRTVNIEVIPLKNLRERCFLILFEEPPQAGQGIPAQPPQPSRSSRPSVKETGRVAELQRELAETRDYVQSMQEQHEAANEELQASNEEVQSSNEELQSINEELETAKEELESSNEELTTVNEEMAHRNTELSRLNSDLNNLHVSINTAILVLSRDLTIRRFTPLAEKAFNLLATDLGRSLGGIRHNVDLPNLEDLVRQTIDTVSGREREVQDKQGRWYVLRVRPYMTLDNKVDGAVLVLVDIDALKRTEREVKAARDYAEAILRTARDPLLVLRADLRVNTANGAFYQTFKTAPDHTEGCLIFKISGGAWDIPKLHTLLEDILRRNSFFNDFEVTHDFPHIGQRTMLLAARRLDLDDGSPPMILLAIEDVTDRQQLQEAKSLLASIVESSDDSIISINFDQIITSWNPGAARLYGYPAAEAIGKSLTMLSLPEGLTEALARVDKVKHGAKLETFEVERQLKDGRHLFVSVTLSLVKDASGQPIGLSTLSRDITERKQAEKVLAERARLLDLTDDAIIVRDLEGHIVYWNQGAERLYGWPREEALGKITHSLLNTQFSIPFEQITEELLKTNRWEGEFVQTKRDGQSITVLARKSLDRDKQGNPTAILETLTDITTRKRTEDALRQAQARLADRAGQLEQAVVERTEELTETNKQLEAFVYSIAHDLRAPLRSMQGFSAMLVEEVGASLSEKGRELAGRINRSALFMDALLIDLLAFSRISQERLELTSVNLGPLVASVLNRLQSDIQARNARVESTGPWPVVVAHEPTLAQVLVNLLDNALKFVAKDVSPLVHLRTEEQADGNWIRVWIEDNGIGISPDHQDAIFRLFTRLHGGKYPGTGIGLAIVQKGVERLGGRMGLESTPGQGSRFWFELKKASP